MFLNLLNSKMKLKIVQTPGKIVKMQFFLQNSHVLQQMFFNEQVEKKKKKCLILLMFLRKKGERERGRL